MAEDQEIEVDDWEDLEDSGILDKKLDQIVAEQEAQRQVSQMKPLQVPQECLPGTQYKPTVKILQRKPEQQNKLADRSNTSTKPSLTLEQREAAYAEARMRIFGAAATEEEEPTNDNRPMRLQERFENLAVASNVVRQPKGPDGTSGFTSSR